MRDWTAAEILAIPESRPERLFSSGSAVVREYQTLAKLWHPDVNPATEANDVLAHLNILRKTAEEKISKGHWDDDSTIEFTALNGKKFRFRSRARQKTEYGEIVYGPKTLIFFLRKDVTDLLVRGKTIIGGFHFAGKAMEEEMSKYLPRATVTYDTADGHVLVTSKTPDVYLLRHVLAALGGKMEVSHMAWVMSSLLNLACYMEYADLTHNAINLDSVFVSPQFHSSLLLGGWWYGANVGQKLLALPPSSAKLASPDFLKAKTATSAFDLTLIHALGRELLGDPSGHRLKGSVPDPIYSFLRLPPASTAREDYAAWYRALEASYGRRRFTKLDIPESAIYTN